VSAPRSATPARTHAIVVGIEEYPAWPGLGKIPGTVGDACAVARWLLRRGVPPGQIRLFLSPMPGASLLASQEGGGVSLARVVLDAPETIAFRTVVTEDLRKPADAELLFFFWFGHGLIKADHYPRLLFADATENDPRCLDLNSLTRSLRTDYFASFRLQIFVVDACQEYAEYTEGLAGRVVDWPFPATDHPADRLQYELYSTFPGRRAFAKESGDPKSFAARLLLAGLEGRRWAPGRPGRSRRNTGRRIWTTWRHRCGRPTLATRSGNPPSNCRWRSAATGTARVTTP
jgi:hypothetical protein